VQNLPAALHVFFALAWVFQQQWYPTSVWPAPQEFLVPDVLGINPSNTATPPNKQNNTLPESRNKHHQSKVVEKPNANTHGTSEYPTESNPLKT